MKRGLAVLALLLIPALALQVANRSSAPRVVVYCAHDSIHADQILKEFTRQTGIQLDVRYDTEASKSFGLVETLLAEKDAPRCDVFWNNEMLGTLRLAREGVLAPFQPANAARIPAAWKAPVWTAFGARARVLLAGPEVSAETLHANAEFPRPDAAARTALAKPLYGTTRTHVTALWQAWGQEKFQNIWTAATDGGLRLVDGNSLTAQLVASGATDLGYTDTDDLATALRNRPDLQWTPVLIQGRAVVIPNTLCLIQGAPHAEDAKRLIEFLLSTETETALANGAAHQIPLGDVDNAKLPEFVRQMRPLLNHSLDLRALEAADAACLSWLKAQALRQPPPAVNRRSLNLPEEGRSAVGDLKDRPPQGTKVPRPPAPHNSSNGLAISPLIVRANFV